MDWRPGYDRGRRILVATYTSWRSDRTIRMGAGLAYYGLFSLSSVVAIAFGLFRVAGRSAAVEEALQERFEQLLGDPAGASVSELLDRLDGSSGTPLGLFGLGSLLVTGSLFFLALEDAIHQIFAVPVRSGIRSTVQRRLISLVVLLGAAATLVLSLAVQSASGLLRPLVPASTPALETVSSALTNTVSLAVLAAALALLYRYLPSVEISWRPVLVAAGATSLFLVVGTALVGWYLRTVGVSSLGGVASTPIIVLVWIYYEAQILLAGVQLCKTLAESGTRRVTASPTA